MGKPEKSQPPEPGMAEKTLSPEQGKPAKSQPPKFGSRDGRVHSTKMPPRRRRVLGLVVIAAILGSTFALAFFPWGAEQGQALVLTNQGIVEMGSGGDGQSWNTPIILEGLGAKPVVFDHTTLHVIVRNSHFVGDPEAITVDGAINIRVEDSSFTSCATGISVASGQGITITGNTFLGCQVGLSIDTGSIGTAITLNNFTNNAVVAYDASASSEWTVDGTGNFYADYMDEFPDAQLSEGGAALSAMFDRIVGGAFVGSEPYLIPVSPTAAVASNPTPACDQHGPHGEHVDCCPLVYVPNHEPQIVLNKPLSGSLLGDYVPAYNITAAGEFVTTVTYAINGTSFPIMTGFSLFGCQTFLGVVDPAAWDALSSGMVNISCTVKTWFNRTATDFALVERDVDAPVVTVNLPLPGSVHAGVPPAYDLTIVDPHVASKAYRIGASASYNVTSSGIGSIDADAWAAQPEGELDFVATVVDTLGNTRAVTVPIFKDLTPPALAVAFPKGTCGNQTIHGFDAPAYTLTAQDSFLDKCWYEIAGVTGAFPASTTGTIDAGAWASLGNQSVAITFYANDTVGHVASLQITLYRDVIAPAISILNPTPWQVLGSTGPAFSITIDEAYLARAWIAVEGAASNYTIGSCTGYIPSSIWEQSANGTVLVTFYANDTAGNLGCAHITVHHDVIDPGITVNEPVTSFTYGLDAPTYDLDISEANLAYVRYSIDAGVTWFDLAPVAEITGTIDAAAWHAVPLGDWTFQVVAGDLAANEATVSVQCSRDPAPPLIQLVSPSGGIFGNSSVPLELTVIDTYLANVWYELNWTAGQYFLPASGSIEAVIDIDAWLACPDGFVKITIFANDTLGNEENATLVVAKDTTPAAVTITSPLPDALFVAAPPELEFTVEEAHWQTARVMVEGYANTFLVAEGQSSFTLGASFWNALPDGAITIILAVNDTVTNQGTASIQVRKDSTRPSLSLASVPAGLWGTSPPQWAVNVVDANLASAFLTIDGTTTQYTLTASPSILVEVNATAWAGLDDGTHVFVVTCVDEGGLVGTLTVSLEKDSTAPVIVLKSLVDGMTVSRDAPRLCAVFEDPHFASAEYSLDGGQTFFAYSPCGSIDASAWDAAFVPGESLTIIIRATDTVNNTVTRSVTLACEVDDLLSHQQFDTLLMLVIVVLVSILVGVKLSERRVPGTPKGTAQEKRSDFPV